MKSVPKSLLALGVSFVIVGASSPAIADGSMLLRQASPAEIASMPFASAQEVARLKATPAYKSVTTVKVETTAFSGNVINITLPSGTVRMVGSPQGYVSGGHYMWTAKPDKQIYSAIFSIDGTNVYGTLQTRTANYELRTLPNGMQVVVEIDQDAANGAVDTIAPPDKAASKPEIDAPVSLPESQSSLVIPELSSTAAASGPTVRILVAYSSHAAAALGSNLNGGIKAAIRQINDANTASGVTFQAVLAGTLLVNYQGPYDTASTLAAFEKMPTVKAAHDSMAADLMVMLENMSATADAGQAAGLNVPYYNAYAVVSTTFMTSNLSFAHEVGHLMGADHAPSDTSASPFLKGHGTWVWEPASLVDTRPGYCAHSVMAYAMGQSNERFTDGMAGRYCLNDPRIDVWSNSVNTIVVPAVGVAGWLGGGNRDNGSVLNVTAPDVSQFHTHALNVAKVNPNPPPNCKINPRACA